MKTMIAVVLAFVACNANAQIAPIAPALSVTFSYSDIVCTSYDIVATENCIAVNNDLEVVHHIGIEKMTPKQKNMLHALAEQIIKDQK